MYRKGVQMSVLCQLDLLRQEKNLETLSPTTAVMSMVAWA